ncbi:MAG: hypothetical protein F4X98_00795 [Gammaproteobacteria bacterium]|nr:hypothetical protein [Gammaproteobacteria bacterium]
MVARAAVVCAILAVAGCGILNLLPREEWTVDDEGNRVWADNAWTWMLFRQSTDMDVLDEAAGRRPSVYYASWHHFWLRRSEALVESQRKNLPKHLGYIAERRRQEGLPDVDVRRGFGEDVDVTVRREAAGGPTGLAAVPDDWDGFWLWRIGKLWRVVAVADAALDEEELVCRIVLRRREYGLPELPGPARDCRGTLPPAAPKRVAEQSERGYGPWWTPERIFADPAARALAEAASRGRVRTVDRLVAADTDVNASGIGGINALSRAGNLRVFRRLLELGADPNVLYDDGRTKMHYVARYSDERYLDAALAHGGDPNVRDAWGDTPLSASPIGMWPNAVRALLDAPGVDIEAPNRHGTTVAMKVAGVRDDILLALLERGADYEARNAAGYSVLDRLAFQRPLMFPGTTEARACDKVIAWLAARGVELPEPRVRLPASPSADWQAAR